jgi:hypothetical protein
LYSGTSAFNILAYANPSLNELFDSPNFNLIQLSKYSDDLLKETGVFQILLKLGGQKTKEVLGWIETHPEYIAKLMASPYKYGAISYLLELEKRKNPLAIIENLVNLFPIFKDDIMSAAQQLRQEGRQVGMQEGRQEEKLQVAKSMLQDKESIDKIVKWTGLTKKELEKLRK